MPVEQINASPALAVYAKSVKRINVSIVLVAYAKPVEQRNASPALADYARPVEQINAHIAKQLVINHAAKTVSLVKSRSIRINVLRNACAMNHIIIA